MMRRLAVALFLGLIASACTGSSGTEDTAQPDAAVQPTATATAVAPTLEPVATATPEPELPAAVTLGIPDLDGALQVALQAAPLGTYVVAKRDAGIARATVLGQAARREIPVYDEPFGPPRTLLDVNRIDGTNLPVNLTNWDDPDGALVMRVIAGGPDDDWLIVQAPSRPLDSYVWVRANDFDFGFTTQRIEIDLAGEGLLQVFDGDQVIMRSAIVQGRESRPTPSHLTYLQRGIPGGRVSPAYGEMILSMASFSESLGTFGGAGLPSMFIHGTNQPELMGQRVSSGSIRLPNAALLNLVELVLPGTPVLIYEGSRDLILERQPLPATTVDFVAGSAGVGDVTTGLIPELWRRCEQSGSRSEIDPTVIDDSAPVQAPDGKQQLLCRNDGRPEIFAAGSTDEHVFAVAKPDAGEIYLSAKESESDKPPVPAPRRMIPVFDHPLGEARALVYTSVVDRIKRDYPLYTETVFGEPTVLSVVKMTADASWLLVRAPVLPHNTTVWVRGEDFDLQSTTLRVEVDLGYEFLGRVGMLSVWDGDQSIMAAKISSGRESRPSTTTSTYIDQVIEGSTLAPAYGPWLFSTPSYSEYLGTFGGGGMPQQSIHGIGPGIDEVLGTPSSSGSIHISYDAILEMAEIDDRVGLVGAPVVIYDSRSPSTSLPVVRRAPLGMAETKPIHEADRTSPVGSFT